jgi:hypothetical protein
VFNAATQSSVNPGEDESQPADSQGGLEDGEDNENDTGVVDMGTQNSESTPLATPAPSVQLPLTPIRRPSSLGKRGSTDDLDDTPAPKRGKMTGPDAILAMSNSIWSVGEAIVDAFGRKGEATPVRKSCAQALL